MKPNPRFHGHRKLCGLAGFVTLLCGTSLLAFEPNEWRQIQTLNVPASGLVQVNLPATTLDAAQPGLEDLRIVDAAGNIHNSQVFEARLRRVQCCRWEIYLHQTRRRNVECLYLTPFVWLKCQKRCPAKERDKAGEAAELTMAVESWIWFHCFSPQPRGTADIETMRGWR